VQGFTAAASATFTFVGDHIRVGVIKRANTGIFDVLVDGVVRGTYDLYNSTTIQAVIYDSVIQPYGSHTVQVRTTGTCNPSSSCATKGVLDYFEYLSLSATPTAVASVTPTVSPTPAGGLLKLQSRTIYDTTGSNKGSTTLTCNVADLASARTIVCATTFNGSDTSGSQAQIIGARVAVQHNPTSGTVTVYYNAFTVMGSGASNTYGQLNLGTKVSGNISGSVSLTGANSTNLAHEVEGGSSYTGILQGYGGLILSLDPINATPTPGVTPVSGAYCGSVDGSNAADIFNDIQVFTVQPGQASCITIPEISLHDIFGWLIDFFSFAIPDDVETFVNNGVVEASTWCAQEVGFTQLSLLGVSLPWALFVEALLWVYVISHFISK